jgi:hypothetical protein
MIDVSARRSQHKVMGRCSNDTMEAEKSGRGSADAMRKTSGRAVGRAPARKRSATAADSATQGDELTVLQ